MATYQEEQPVLLTEGSFVQEDVENPIQEQRNETTAVNESSVRPEQQGSEPLAASSAETPPVKSADHTEKVRPASATETSGVGDSESVLDIQRSVMGILSSASQSPALGGIYSTEDEMLQEKLEKVPAEKGDEYVAPQEDPYMRAVNYMEKHKVMQIFQKLTAEIVYHRPLDPLDHMLSELTKMKKERDERIDQIISSGVSKTQSGDQ